MHRTISRHAPALWLTAQEIAGYLMMLAGILGVFAFTFRFLHLGFVHMGWSDSLATSAGIWVLVGIPSALFWPLRYRSGMRGQWLSSTPHIALLSLAGPFALLLGFPL